MENNKQISTNFVFSQRLLVMFYIVGLVEQV